MQAHFCTKIRPRFPPTNRSMRTIQRVAHTKIAFLAGAGSALPLGRLVKLALKLLRLLVSVALVPTRWTRTLIDAEDR